MIFMKARNIYDTNTVFAQSPYIKFGLHEASLRSPVDEVWPCWSVGFNPLHRFHKRDNLWLLVISAAVLHREVILAPAGTSRQR